MINFEYPDDIDQELIPLLNSLNNIIGVQTQFSCCGHGDSKLNDFYIFLHCISITSLRKIRNAFSEHITIRRKGFENINGWYVFEMMELEKTPPNCIGVRITNDAICHLDEKERICEYNKIILKLRQEILND